MGTQHRQRAAAGTGHKLGFGDWEWHHPSFGLTPNTGLSGDAKNKDWDMMPGKAGLEQRLDRAKGLKQEFTERDNIGIY